jgi:hypothetical protein
MGWLSGQSADGNGILYVRKYQVKQWKNGAETTCSGEALTQTKPHAELAATRNKTSSWGLSVGF